MTMPHDRTAGFTLIELPAYQDYTIRSKVAEGLSVAA